MNINMLKTFIQVVELKSITQASRCLIISPAAVSKQIKNLEKSLGIPLIKRSSSFFEITETGYIFYEKAKNIVKEMNNLQNLAHSLQEMPQGELKIFSSIAFGEIYLLPYLKKFMKMFPKVILKIELNDRLPDLQVEKIDICLRLAGHWDTNLIRKKLLTATPQFWAAKSYLKSNGEPKIIKELKNHQLIIHSNRPFIENTIHDIQLMASNIYVNNYNSLYLCAKEDLGIILTYDFISKNSFQFANLEQIFVKENFQKINFYGYYLPSNILNPSLKAFLNFYQEEVLPIITCH